MKTYREQYNDLRFSPEEKQAMVESLLAAVPETQKRVSHKKRLHVLVAAVVAAALCAACASGALRSASEVFANLFGSSQEQASLLEELGTPLGVSCTQDGLTITADAILADEYTYAILYSIQREDGTSLRADGRGESVSFQEYTMQWPQKAQRTSSTLRPYDEDTSDQTVQYLEICQMDQPLQAGRMTAVFRAAMIDEVQADGTIRTVPLGDGPWELSFDFTPKASSIDLPTGQQFQVDGLDCTLTRVSLSPLSLHVEYTVDAAEVPDENAFLNALPLSLAKTDGTVAYSQRDAASGLHSDSDSDQIQARKDLVFSEITPLDTIESISIGDLTIPVPQS